LRLRDKALLDAADLVANETVRLMTCVQMVDRESFLT
jgi:hypothetical protein